LTTNLNKQQEKIHLLNHSYIQINLDYLN